MDRSQVYELIDEERDYQCDRHEVKTAEFPHRDEDHSVADWLIYMEHHLREAKWFVYNLNHPDALREIRKIAALGVACMEYNDTPPR